MGCRQPDPTRPLSGCRVVTAEVAGLAPRWASPPGETIASALRGRDIGLADAADALALTVDQMPALLDGALPITTELARALSTTVGGSAEFWIAREAQYHDDRARVKADRWAQSLPVNEMASWGWIRHPSTWQERIIKCLDFFDIDDTTQFQDRWGTELDATHYRTSPSFNVETGPAAVWFRACELAADSIEGMPTFTPAAFARALSSVKPLTRLQNPRDFIPALVSLCASAGVAVAVVRAPQGCPASGAARLYRQRPLIQLSGRHLSDDHFWFTFLHEAGHVINHSLGSPFLDVLDDHQDSKEEVEANEFASEWIMGRPHDYAGSVASRAVIRLAHENGVAPGLVVGQLQHTGRIEQSQLNTLKRRFRWDGPTLEMQRKH